METYRIKVLFLFLAMILMIYKVDGFIGQKPLISKVIYIDPGHGGVDPGAQYKDIYEKNINLEISKLLVAKLEEKGAIVYLTREDDYDLSIPNAYLRKRSDLNQRIQMIDSSNCHLYLSIHLNASQSTSWRGAQVFYTNINDKNKEIAEIIQNNFKKRLGSKREIKEINNLYMYNRVKRPGVLVELGFISNPSDRYILRQTYYQQKIVNVIVDSVIEYFSQ